MRLGSYACVLGQETLAAKVYGVEQIDERHRHRYEMNNQYRDIMSENGLRFSGLSPDELLVEIVEIPGHPWFLGCQFHPEFKSRPYAPHPLFSAFVELRLQQQVRATLNPTD